MNKVEIFKEKIEPLFNEVKEECLLNDIPFFVTFCVSDDGTNTEYIQDMLSPSALNKNVTKDRFPDLVNVMNGFSTYLSNEDKEFTLNKILRELPEDEIGSLDDEDEDNDEYF